MRPDGNDEIITVDEIRDEDGNEMESCPHPKQRIYIKTSSVLSVHDLLRRKEA